MQFYSFQPFLFAIGQSLFEWVHKLKVGGGKNNKRIDQDERVSDSMIKPNAQASFLLSRLLRAP